MTFALLLMSLLSRSVSAEATVPVTSIPREIPAESEAFDESMDGADLESPALRKGRRQLEAWFHERHRKMTVTEAEKRILGASLIAASDQEIKKYFAGFETNPNREEKACFLSRIIYKTSELSVIDGLRKMGFLQRSLKRRFVRDEIIDGLGARVRDHLVDHFLDTECGKAQAFERLGRLSVAECDLTLERVKEQIKDGTDMLENAKLSADEKAIVYLNLGLQYIYAFQAAPKESADKYRREAMSSYRKVSELFPETLPLSKVCVDAISIERQRPLKPCVDAC